MKIAYIDDNAEDLLGTLSPDARELFVESNPTEESERQLAFESARDADLWVFDYFYGEHDASPLHLDEENGLSYFQKWRRFAQDDRPPTALVSNDLERAFGEDYRAPKGHLFAERHGVEWVGDKRAAEPLIKLAEASVGISAIVKTLRGSASGEVDQLSLVCQQVLGLPDTEWRRPAERHVDRARPPHVLSATTDTAAARETMAWLLQRVLPYAGFLVSDRQAAVLLNLQLGFFRDVVDGRAAPRLAEAFAARMYTGPLNTFAGRRWWRPGLDHLVWSFSQQAEGYQAELSKLMGATVAFLPQENPVVVHDQDLEETDDVADVSECVRAQDGDFPADVAPVWVRRELVGNDPKLAEKIIFDDRDLLSDESE